MAEEADAPTKPDFTSNFQSLLRDVELSRDALKEGLVPRYETPEQAIQDYVKKAEVDEGQFAEELLSQGFDLYEGVEQVSRGDSTSGDYLVEAELKRQEVKDLYEQERGPKVVRESRERITEALKQKDPTTLPKEVVSAYLGPVVQDPSKGFILDNDVSVKFSDEESGIFNTGEANQRERLTDLSPRAEATQLAQMMVATNDNISKYVDLYGSSVDGADRYIAQRLNDMADSAIKDDPTGFKRDAFLNDQSNYQKALREIAILRTAGLWTAPILVNPEMLLGEDRELPGTLLGDIQAGIKTAFSPTIEIIGVADRKNNSALVARQASAMRTAFDVMDIPQQIVTGVLREADSKPLGEAALSVASSPVRWLTDDNLRKEVINSLGRKDELFSYALESEMARAGTAGMAAAATLGLVASIFFPDTFFLAGKLGKLSKLGQASERIKDVRDAKRAVTYMGRVEESANDMEAIDKLESVFLNIDASLQSDLRRDTLQVAQAMHEAGKKGDRVANMGAEGNEVSKLLPDGIVQVQGADGEVIKLDNMRLRAPHLAPALRRARTTSPSGSTTTGYAEAYNLNNRRKEFESLKKAAETRDPALIAPQFRTDNRKAINTFAAQYQKASGGKVPFFFRTGKDMIKKSPKVSGRTFGSAPIGVAMRGPDEFKAFIRKVTDFDKLSAAQQKNVDKVAESFAKKAQKWAAKNSDEAFDNLDSAINKGLKAVQANHEARVVAAAVNRQKIAKRFGIAAPIKNPQLLEAADKLPQFSASARAFRESLIDKGIDDSLATFITGTLDARARRHSARTGEDTKRWWDSRIEGAAKADPPKPATPTPAAPTPAKPAAPTAPAKPAAPAPPAPKPAPKPAAPAKPKKKAPKRPKKPPAKPPKTTAVPEGLQPPAYVEPPAPSAAAKKKADPTKFKAKPYAAHVFDDETRQPQELLEHLTQFGSFGKRQVNEKGGAQLVDWLSKHGSSAATRTIAARIEPILRKSRMEVRLYGKKGVTPAGYNADYRSVSSHGYHRRALGSQPIVLGINVHGGMNEGTIIHELLHAATVPALAAANRASSVSTYRKSADRLEELSTYVVKAARRRRTELRRIKSADRTTQQKDELIQIEYLLMPTVLGSGKGPRAQTELISHALSNGMVTQFMKTLPPMDKAAGKSAFSEFVDLIARLFNKGKAVSKAERSAFEDVIEASEEFLTQSEIYYYGNKNVDGLPKKLAKSTEGPQRIADAKLKPVTFDELPEVIGKKNTLELLTDFAKKESDGLVRDPKMRTDQVLVDENNKIAAVLSDSLTGEDGLRNEYRINVNVRPDMRGKGIANALIDDAIMKFETEYAPETVAPIMEIRVNTSYDPSVAAHLESRGFVVTGKTEKVKLFGKKDLAEVKTFRYDPENVARVGEPDIQLAAADDAASAVARRQKEVADAARDIDEVLEGKDLASIKKAGFTRILGPAFESPQFPNVVLKDKFSTGPEAVIGAKYPDVSTQSAPVLGGRMTASERVTPLDEVDPDRLKSMLVSNFGETAGQALGRLVDADTVEHGGDADLVGMRFGADFGTLLSLRLTDNPEEIEFLLKGLSDAEADELVTLLSEVGESPLFRRLAAITQKEKLLPEDLFKYKNIGVDESGRIKMLDIASSGNVFDYAYAIPTYLRTGKPIQRRSPELIDKVVSLSRLTPEDSATGARSVDEIAESARIELAAKPPTPVTPTPSPELIIADDGRALLKGFENADLNDVVRATTQVIVRDLDTVELDGLIKYLNDQGISVNRKGADITGDAADVERAYDALGDIMADYVKTGELPLQAKGLKKVFEDMRSDVLNSYRMAKLVKADIPESIRDVMEPLLRSMPADEEPLPTVLETIRTKLLGTPPDRTKQARDLLEDIRKEALRQGTDVDYDDLIRKIDEFKDTDPKKVVLETDRPLFPALVKVKADEATGKYRYNIEDIADIQRRIQEAPGSPESIYLEDAYESSLLTTKRKDRSAVEKFYGLTRKGSKDKRSLADLKAALKEDSYFDDEFLDDIISRGDIFADEIANRVRPIIRVLGKSILGGDELADLAGVSPVIQQKILAGQKMVEQAVGDSVRLTTEVHATKGDLNAKAWDQLYTYLSGGTAVYVRGGRAAVSSGTDKFMDLAEEAQTFVQTTLTAKERGYLQNLMDAVNSKVLGDGRVVAPTPTSDVMKAIKAAKGFDEATRALEKLFKGDGYQFFADFNKSIVVTPDKGLNPASYQAYESLFYHLGITKRNGKPVAATNEGLSASLVSKSRVRAFLDEIQQARQGAEGKAQFGAHSNESAVTRIAVLLGSHGTAQRVRQLWADSGVYVDGKIYQALSRWNQGLAIEPELLPAVERAARTFGLNPNLVKDPVFELNNFIPQQARSRLSDALARGLVKDTGIMLAATEDDLSGLWQTYNRFLKISMVRGAYVLKQRYFFMNTYDHFNQLAQTVGFAPALASTLRVVTNDITVFPGATPVLALLARNNPNAPEAFRKWVQKGGDKLSNLVTDMVSNSKWRVGVNEVLDGRDGFIRIGGNVYSYKQLRDIATEEGIFSSFDTSNLRKSLTAADAEQQRAATNKLGSALTDTSNFHGWYRTHLDDTAEAWSERERVGAMITLIEMGADPRAAAKTAIEALYDYAGSMSKGDRNVWINIIFPFWSFQKNANRQFVNNLFSLTGVYRMNVLRRGRERLADAASELMYQSITDQYGINEEALPPETRQYYMGFKKQIENGLGPIEDLDPSTAQMLRKQYGVDDLNKLPPDQKAFLENGYGGREKVPPRVVQEIRLVLSGEVRPGQPFAFEGGRPQIFESGAENYVLDILQQSDEFQKIRLAAVRKPDKTARRSYLRDRLGISLPLEPTPSARLYYQMMGQISPDHGYFEVFLPESAMEASMRHVAGIAATVIMGGGMLAGQAVSSVTGVAETVTGLPVGLDTGTSADIAMTAVRENLRTVADVERAPMLAQLLFPFTGDSTAPPIRIHPWLANVIQTQLPYLSLLEIKGKRDLFALVESGEMDEQEAYQIFTADPGVVALQEPADLSDDVYVQVQELHPQVDPALIQKIVDVSRDLEIPADVLAAAIQVESNFSPSATNSQGSPATGLIQFMPSTAKGMGTTVEDLAAMSAVDQMAYVHRYLAPYKGKIKSEADVNMAIFYPRAIGKSDDFDIADDYYEVKLRQYKREGLSDQKAKNRAGGEWKSFVAQNPGIRTRGDYLQMAERASSQKADYGEEIPAPTTRLPTRAKEGYELTEDRFYMFPGPMAIFMQLSGLTELNRMLMSELPTVKTSLTRAGVGENYLDTPQGRIAIPNNRVGIALWANYVLGLQSAEVTRGATAKAEEPKVVTKRVGLPK